MAPGGPTAAHLLASSYATQAGAGGAAAGSNTNANAAAAFFGVGNNVQQQQGNNQQNREFSADDFPALGAPSDQHHHHQQQQQINGYPAGINGQTRSNQEQASAAAALAHRQNLLGTMSAGAQNQARSVANAADNTLLQDDSHPQKRVSGSDGGAVFVC